jgi:hypothetical protein
MNRDELLAHLVATRIAGDVATPRADNLANINHLLDREPKYTFGLTTARAWDFAQVLALMADRVGIDPDPDRRRGGDRIDPVRCLDGLDRARARILDVMRSRGRVLLATGHPTGLLAFHQQVAVALRAAGCEILQPADDTAVTVDGHRGRVLYVGGVAVLATGAHLLHTHRPEPMRVALAACEQPPDLVVADHGWAGTAGESGLVTVGFADCNDPALFVGEAEGKVAVTVPLDDNVSPRHYAPLAGYVTT